jgi:membrane protease YdiL (CAAX protease family)
VSGNSDSFDFLGASKKAMSRVKNVKERRKPWQTALLMQGIAAGPPFIILMLLDVLFSFIDFKASFPWLIYYYMMEVPMLLISVFIIRRLSKGKFGNYGFNLRSRDLKLAFSIVGGTLFALFMALIDYLPPIVRGRFEIGYDLTFTNVLGTLSFMWIFVGIAEESLSRGLIQTYLMNNMSGDVKIASWNIKRATILGGLIFGLSHFFNIYRKPLEFVIPQMIYATVFGIIVGYVYQETQSLAGPIVMHNVADGLETTIEYLLYLSVKQI